MICIFTYVAHREPGLPVVRQLVAILNLRMPTTVPVPRGCPTFGQQNPDRWSKKTKTLGTRVRKALSRFSRKLEQSLVSYGIFRPLNSAKGKCLFLSIHSIQ